MVQDTQLFDYTIQKAIHYETSYYKNLIASYTIHSLSETLPLYMTDTEVTIDNVVNITYDLESTIPKELTYDIIGLENYTETQMTFSDIYTETNGILTFRGNNFRSSPSYGFSTIEDHSLKIAWAFETGCSSWGGGAGWTGQPALVQWPEETKLHMNLFEEFKQSNNFVEVIYASLDGHIYFLDLETGLESRPSINTGNPIKGSVSIDSRGYPLLYVGEGIPENNTIGYSIYNLLNGELLYRINGYDSDAYRRWGAFDSSALLNIESDILIIPGENGLIYFVRLNTLYDNENMTISLSPAITKYRYQFNGRKRLGIESSVAAYKNLLYVADNSGYIQCIDLISLEPIWLVDAEDDTDSSITLELENDIPFIYTGNEVDFQGSSGESTIRKINGLTGDILWERSYTCKSILGEHPVNGGLFGTPVIGKKLIDNMIIVTIARYENIKTGLITALDKTTGNTIWESEMQNYAWSSPTDFYDSNGNAYIIQCNSIGEMALINGINGKELDKIQLNANIESSPAIYNDYIVVATRGRKIYGINIE